MSQALPSSMCNIVSQSVGFTSALLPRCQDEEHSLLSNTENRCFRTISCGMPLIPEPHSIPEQNWTGCAICDTLFGRTTCTVNKYYGWSPFLHNRTSPEQQCRHQKQEKISAARKRYKLHKWGQAFGCVSQPKGRADKYIQTRNEQGNTTRMGPPLTYIILRPSMPTTLPSVTDGCSYPNF